MADQRHDDGAPLTAEVAPIRRIKARGGVEMPALGLGTWTMGEKGSRGKQEIAALRLGFDLGMIMVDTAEMYADGGAEEVVAEAVRGRRDEVFIVTKVLPENASYEGTIKAAERSLRRLGTDRSRYDATPECVALAWTLRQPMDVSIPSRRTQTTCELTRGR